MPPKKLYYQVRPSAKIGVKDEKIVLSEKRPMKYKEIFVNSLDKQEEQKKKLDKFAENLLRQARDGGGGRPFRTAEQEKFLNFLKEKYKTPSQKIFEEEEKKKLLERQRLMMEEQQRKQAEKEARDIQTLNILQTLPAEIRNLLPAMPAPATATPASSPPGSPLLSGATGVTLTAVPLGRFARDAQLKISPSEEADFQAGRHLNPSDTALLNSIKQKTKTKDARLLFQTLFENNLTTNQNVQLFRKTFRDGKQKELIKQLRNAQNREAGVKKTQLQELASYIDEELRRNPSAFD